MIIIPAIDIQGGKVVRLQQGHFDQVTVYSEDPLAMAKKWVEQGAEQIHIVDLDGARTGEIINLEIILKIAQEISIPVQVGGGIRTFQDIQNLINGGVSRIVLGTKAIVDRDFVREVLTAWDDKIAVSLDCKDGLVTQQGWTVTSDLSAVNFIDQLEKMGVSCVIYTDISRDGMLTGPNLLALIDLLDKTNIPVIASGGVSSIDDIKRLKNLESKGLSGAIIGKAIYAGSVDLKNAIEISKMPQKS